MATHVVQPAASTVVVRTDVSDEAAARERRAHAITFVSYPSVIYLWPLILAGFLGWPLWESGIDREVLGWCYLAIVVVTLTTFGFDLNRNYLAFLVVLIAAIWVLGLWLRDVHGITIFGNIYRWFADLNVGYNREFGLALSVIIGVPFLIAVVWSWINNRWRFTNNEFEHYSFGRVAESLGRGAKTVRIEYPDMLELLIALSGTVVVFDAAGQSELRRIRNVPFLPMRRRKLDRILEQTAFTVGPPMEG